jgi:FixJ family two-component response regulator
MKKSQGHKKDLSVIVLEDNDGDFVLIEDYLIEVYKTVKIKRCENYSDFLQKKETIVDFDIILLDLHLPDLSGIDLVENILALNLHIPIIIFTGYTDLTLAKESLKLGIEDFLIKDEVSINILHKSIEYALSRNLYIKHIQAQNEKLRNIAWTQSHVVRTPLARMLGIIDVIETEKGDLEDLMFWLKQLKVSSQEMDVIVRQLTEEAQEIILKKNNE